MRTTVSGIATASDVADAAFGHDEGLKTSEVTSRKNPICILFFKVVSCANKAQAIKNQ